MSITLMVLGTGEGFSVNQANQMSTLATFFERAIHDLSSDLHVTQFCVDELLENVGPKNTVIINKLSEASFASIEKIKNYRNFLTLWQRSEKEFLSLDNFVDLLKIISSVVRDNTKKSTLFSYENNGFNERIDAQEWLPVVFSFVRVVRENTKIEQLDFKLSFEKINSSEQVSLSFVDRLIDENVFFETKKIFESHFLFDIKKDHERFLLRFIRKSF